MVVVTGKLVHSVGPIKYPNEIVSKKQASALLNVFRVICDSPPHRSCDLAPVGPIQVGKEFACDDVQRGPRVELAAAIGKRYDLGPVRILFEVEFEFERIGFPQHVLQHLAF
jgi:hypothetical protein